MPGYDELIGSAAASPAPEPSNGYAALVGQFDVAPEEYAKRSHRAGLAAGRSADEQEKILRGRGFSASATKAMNQQFKLDKAVQEMGQPGVWQQFKEHGIPFRSVFVNQPEKEAEASRRFAEGKASDDDIKTLASARKRQEQEESLKNFGVAGDVIGGLRAAPTIIGEFMAGGALAKAAGIGQAARLTLGGQLGSHAGRMAVVAAASPTMYLDHMRQKNLENGREADDWRGMPGALAHAYANMLVIGSVFRGQGSVLGKGVKGAVEVGVADAATNFIDNFLPKAYKISTGYGTFEKLMEGDVSGAARKFASDSLTFAALAGIHRLADGLAPDLAQKAATDFTEIQSKDLVALRKSGLSMDAAAQRINGFNDRIKEQVRLDPESAAKMADYIRLRQTGLSAEEAFRQAFKGGRGSPFGIEQGPRAITEGPRALEAGRPEVAERTAEAPPEPPTVAPEARPAEPTPKSPAPEIAPPDASSEAGQGKSAIPASETPTVERYYRVPDYKTKGDNVDAAIKELVGDQFAGKWFSRSREQNDSYHTEGKVQFEFRNDRFGDTDKVERGEKDVLVGGQAPMYMHPALSAIRYKGKPEGGQYEKLSKLIEDVNVERQKAGLDPIVIEATGAAKAPPAEKIALDHDSNPAEWHRTERPPVDPSGVNIPTGIPNGRGVPDVIRYGDKVDKLAEKAKPENVRSVKIADLVEMGDNLGPLQGVVDKGIAEAYRDQPKDKRKPVVVSLESDGRMFVIEGRHRIVGAKMRGDTEIPAVIIVPGKDGPRFAAGRMPPVDTPGKPGPPKPPPPSPEARARAVAAAKARAGADKVEPPPRKPEDAPVETPDLPAPPADVVGRIDASPLTPAQKNVLVAYALEGSSRKAGARLGVSHEKARQDAQAALEAMRAADKTFPYDSLDAMVKGVRDQAALFDRGRSETTTAEGVTARQKPGVDAEGQLLAGFPLRLTFLEGLFSKGTGADLNAVARKWLTSAGDLPKSVFEANVRRIGEIGAHLQDVKNAERDLTRAVGGDWGGLREVDREIIRSALAGNIGSLRMLPPGPIREGVIAMRQHMDALSQRLVEVGAAEGKMAATIIGNEGVYINRAFQVFTNPKWAETVKRDHPEIVNRFKAWLRDEAKRDGKDLSPEEIDGITESLLYNGTAAENPIAFISKSKLGSKDLSVFKRRKDIPPELRALWGEVRDPIAAYAMTVGKQAHLLQNHLFLAKARDLGIAEGWLTDKPTTDNNVQIAAKGSDTLSPLNGLWTTPEIKKAFEEVYAKENLPIWLKGVMFPLQAAKYAKTILSPVTHLRNLFGNGFFALANGHGRVANAAKAVKALRDDTKDGRDYWRRATELGLTGDSVMGNEFNQVAETALGASDPFTRSAVMTDKGIKRWLKSGKSIVEKAYHNEDTVAKLYAWENEKARYREAYQGWEIDDGGTKVSGKTEAEVERAYRVAAGLPPDAPVPKPKRGGWTDAQIEEHAAKIVRLTYPTYSNVNRFIKTLRNVPFIGPFVSFPAEVIRTTYHTAKLAREEMRDPATRQIGAARMAGLVAAMGVSAASAAAARGLFGVSRDEDDAVRRFMPPWSRDSQLLHLGKTPDGGYKVIDLGRTDPHAWLWEPLVAGLQGKSMPEGIQASLDAAARPFVGEEVFTRAVVNVARNKREETGKEVFNDQLPFWDKAEIGVGHVLKTLQPGVAKQVADLYRAAAGVQDQKTGKTPSLSRELLADFTGQRVMEVKPAEGLVFKAREFDKAKSDAEDIVNGVARQKGMVSAEEIDKALVTSETQRKRVYDDLRDDVAAAKLTGVSQADIVKALKEGGVSQNDIRAILGGVYVPKPAPPRKK